jgi:hypothetical protein
MLRRLHSRIFNRQKHLKRATFSDNIHLIISILAVPRDQYQLTVPTVATLRYPQRLITIPAGTVLAVDSDDIRVGGRVLVTWGNNFALMFAADLLCRAEKVTGKPAAPPPSSE